MFKIIFNIESLRISKNKMTTQAFAEVYCEYSNEVYFPYKGWDDFLLTIATLWSGQLIEVIKDKEANFYFIDGSFFFKSSNYENNRLQLTYYKDGEIIYSQVINKKIFINELLGFLINVINSLKKNLDIQTTKDYIELYNNYMEIDNIKPIVF